MARTFFDWGFTGVIDSTDCLLMAVCLVMPLRRRKEIAAIAIGFVCASVVTLFAAAAGMATDALWLSPLVETAVAVAILIAAAQNIAGGVRAGRRAIESIVFGLVFGFSFSISLAGKVQFGGAHGAAATAAFGAGSTAALLAVFVALPGILRLVFHFTRSERIETIVLSVLAAHASWHWMTERWDRLSRFPFRWPVMDTAFVALSMRWMMILVIFGGVVWFVSGWFKETEAA